jgi:hypothetical protein
MIPTSRIITLLVQVGAEVLFSFVSALWVGMYLKSEVESMASEADAAALKAGFGEEAVANAPSPVQV